MGGTARRHVPSGKLCLRATSPYAEAAWARQWREVGRRQLRPMIPQIVADLEAAATPIAKLVDKAD